MSYSYESPRSVHISRHGSVNISASLLRGTSSSSFAPRLPHSASPRRMPMALTQPPSYASSASAATAAVSETMASLAECRELLASARRNATMRQDPSASNRWGAAAAAPPRASSRAAASLVPLDDDWSRDARRHRIESAYAASDYASSSSSRGGEPTTAPSSAAPVWQRSSYASLSSPSPSLSSRLPVSSTYPAGGLGFLLRPMELDRALGRAFASGSPDSPGSSVEVARVPVLRADVVTPPPQASSVWTPSTPPQEQSTPAAAAALDTTTLARHDAYSYGDTMELQLRATQNSNSRMGETPSEESKTTTTAALISAHEVEAAQMRHDYATQIAERSTVEQARLTAALAREAEALTKVSTMERLAAEARLSYSDELTTTKVKLAREAVLLRESFETEMEGARQLYTSELDMLRLASDAAASLAMQNDAAVSMTNELHATLRTAAQDSEAAWLRERHDALRAEHATALDHAREVHANENRVQHAQLREEVVAEKQALREAHEVALGAHAATLVRRAEASEAELRDEHSVALRQHERDVAAARDLHAAEMRRVAREHAEALTAHASTHSERAEAHAAQQRAVHAAALLQHAREAEAARDVHAAELGRMAREHTETLVGIDSTHAGHAERLRAEHDALREEHAAALALALDNHATESHARLASVREQLAASTLVASSSPEEIAAMRVEYETALRVTEGDMTAVTVQHAQVMEDVVRAHAEALNEIELAVDTSLTQHAAELQERDQLRADDAARFTAELEAMQRAHAAELQQHSVIAEEAASLTEDAVALSQRDSDELAALRLEHGVALAAAEVALSSKMERFAAELEGARASHASALASVRAQRAAEGDDFAALASAKEEEFRAQKESLLAAQAQTAAAAHREHSESLNSIAIAVEEGIAQRAVDLDALKVTHAVEIEELKKALREEEGERREQALEEQRNALEAVHAASVSVSGGDKVQLQLHSDGVSVGEKQSMEAEASVLLDALARDHASSLAEAEREFGAKLQRAATELEAQQREHARASEEAATLRAVERSEYVERAEAQEASLRAQKDELSAAHHESIEAAIAKHDVGLKVIESAVEEGLQRHAAEIATISEEHAAEMATFASTFEATFESQKLAEKASVDAERGAALEELRAVDEELMAQTLSDLKMEFQSELKAALEMERNEVSVASARVLSSKLASALEVARAEHNAHVEALRKERAVESDRWAVVQAEYAAELVTLREEYGRELSESKAAAAAALSELSEFKAAAALTSQSEVEVELTTAAAAALSVRPESSVQLTQQLTKVAASRVAKGMSARIAEDAIASARLRLQYDQSRAQSKQLLQLLALNTEHSVEEMREQSRLLVTEKREWMLQRDRMRITNEKLRRQLKDLTAPSVQLGASSVRRERRKQNLAKAFTASSPKRRDSLAVLGDRALADAGLSASESTEALYRSELDSFLGDLKRRKKRGDFREDVNANVNANAGGGRGARQATGIATAVPRQRGVNGDDFDDGPPVYESNCRTS